MSGCEMGYNTELKQNPSPILSHTQGCLVHLRAMREIMELWPPAIVLFFFFFYDSRCILGTLQERFHGDKRTYLPRPPQSDRLVIPTQTHSWMIHSKSFLKLSDRLAKMQPSLHRRLSAGIS